MKARALGVLVCAATFLGLGSDADAHQLNVFASTDCETVLIEAKFSTGRRPVSGEVRISDGESKLLATGTLTENGTLRIPLAELASTTGLLVEVQSGAHDDYWIITPEDIAKTCQS